MRLDKNKYIEEIAQDMAKRAHLRWEELQVENATVEQLRNAIQMLNRELKKRQKKPPSDQSNGD